MIMDNDEQDSIRRLDPMRPSADKLGKERDFKDAVCIRLSTLETKVRELELIIEEARKSNQSS